MRNAVREYVNTINAKVNVKQNVIVISICSLWVSIFISWMDGSSTYALFDAGTKSLLCFRSTLPNSDSGKIAYPPRWAICPDTLYCPALPSDRAGLLLSIPRNSAPFPSLLPFSKLLLRFGKRQFTGLQVCACADASLEFLIWRVFCFSMLLNFFVPRTHRRSDGFRTRLSCRPCEHCRRSRASICSSCKASRWKLVVG